MAAGELACERDRRGTHLDTDPSGARAGRTRGCRGCPSSSGSAVMPSSSNSARTSCATTRASSKSVPGCGSRSMRSSSACRGSSARAGHTWKPRQPRFTAHAMCARSAITSARDVVPFGVLTIVVSSQSGALSGTRFWKNDEPSAPCGNRCISTGRPPIVRMTGSADGQVVVDEVELGLAALGEQHLAGARDAHQVPVDLELDRVVAPGHRGEATSGG